MYQPNTCPAEAFRFVAFVEPADARWNLERPPEVPGRRLESHAVVLAVLPGCTVQVPDCEAGTTSSVAIVTRCVPAERVPVFIAMAVPPSWERFVTVETVVMVPESTTA